MAEQEIKTTISPISDNTKKAIAEKSVQYFPNNPSAAGKTPQQIKDAFTKPIIDAEVSIFTEIDRVIEEANKVIGNERADREQAIAELGQHEDAREAAHDAEEASYREGIAAELDARVKVIPSERKPGIYGQVGETTQLYPLEFAPYPKNTVVMRSPNGCIYTETDDEEYEIFDDVNHLAVGKRYRVVNIKYLQDELKKSVTPRLDALETALSGTSRNYVIEGLDALEIVLDGELFDKEGERIDAGALVTGDNILLRQTGTPDFWFEKTETGTPPTYIYVEYDEKGNETEKKYILSVKKDDAQVGVLHVLESDYSLIEGKAISAGKAAQEAKEAAEEARGAAEQIDVELAGKVDKVPSSGKEYTVAAVYRNGAASALSADVGTFGGAIPLRDYYGRLRVGTTAVMDDYHAVSVGYLNQRLKEVVSEHHKQFVTREGAAVTKPEGAKNYAQIKEIGGARASYLASPSDAGLWDFVANYPKRILSNTGEVLFDASRCFDAIGVHCGANVHQNHVH